MRQKARILLLDNHDSFTYNLIEYCRFDARYSIDCFYAEDIHTSQLLGYDRMIISPGPGLPQESDSLMQLLEAACRQEVPIFGICLGMQALAVQSGAPLVQSENIRHGIQSQLVEIDKTDILFRNLQIPVRVGRYHSWYVSPDGFPADYRMTSQTVNGIPMSMRHKTLPIWAVQFHPESYLTPQGKEIIQSFLDWETS